MQLNLNENDNILLSNEGNINLFNNLNIQFCFVGFFCSFYHFYILYLLLDTSQKSLLLIGQHFDNSLQNGQGNNIY